MAMKIEEYMSISDAKARLLEVLRRIEEQHGKVVITKNGIPRLFCLPMTISKVCWRRSISFPTPVQSTASRKDYGILKRERLSVSKRRLRIETVVGRSVQNVP